MRLLRFKYLPNLLRLGAFMFVVFGGITLWTLRAAASHVREGMISLGREMMQYADQNALGETRTLAINGTSLDFASGSTRDTLETVLDYYQERCAARDGVSRQLRELEGHMPPVGTGTSRSALTTYRVGDQVRGYVACFDVGQHQLDGREMVRRLQAFVTNGDLRELGHLRYLYAERTNSGRTRFVGFWSDGEINVLHMFPSRGDAPGEDPEGVSRPSGMRRLLSARDIAQPYGMTVYSGPASLDTLETHYRSEMPRSGWRLIPPHGPPADMGSQRLIVFERGNTTANVILAPSNSAGSTATVLLAH